MLDLPEKPSEAVIESQGVPRRRGYSRGGPRKHYVRGGRRRYDDRDKASDAPTAEESAEPENEAPAAADTEPARDATPAATLASPPSPHHPSKRDSKPKRSGKSKHHEKSTQAKPDEKEAPVPDSRDTPQQPAPATPTPTGQLPLDSASSTDGAQPSRPSRGRGRGRGGSRGARGHTPGRNDRRPNGKEKVPSQDEPVAEPVDDETSSNSSSSVQTPSNSPAASQIGASSSSCNSNDGSAKPIIHAIDYSVWAEQPINVSDWASAPGDAPLYTQTNSASTPPVSRPAQPPGNSTPPVPAHQPSPRPPRASPRPPLPSPRPAQASPRPSQASPAPSQAPPLQPPIDDSPTQIRRVGLSHVLLGPGACVQHVFTDAESPWIVISNLPRRTRWLDVQKLVAPFGQTRTIKVYDARADTQWLPTARVLFERHEQAKEAVAGLRGLTVGKGQITVRLDMDRTEGSGYVKGLTDSAAPSSTKTESALIEHDSAAVVKSCTVKVAWFAPTACVYVTYQTPRFALERVKELNGRTYGNRRLHLKPVFSERDNLARVGKENGGYVVRVDGLWANIKTDKLGRYLGSTDIVVQPNYSSEAGLTKLRQDLSDVAPLESFKLLRSRFDDRKFTAMAQYTTPTAAAAAVKVFRDRRGDYLGGSPIMVSRHLSIKYSIPSKLCRVLQGEINRLHSWSMDDPDINVRQANDYHKPGFVQILISGNETKQVASAKSHIDRALAGQPLQDSDGAKIWDRYFLSENWSAFSEKVAEQAGVCIRTDQRTCALLLFGPDYARKEAGDLMRAELGRLAGLRRVLNIPPPVFKRLSCGGLTILRDLVGKGNIYINYFRQSLTFYGDDEVVRRVRMALEVMYSEVGTRLPRHSDCVVCLCQPEESILLHCGHHYCKACFSQYAASAAESRTLPLVCVGRDCKANIPLSMITLHASQPDQDALFHAAFQSYVAAHPEDYRYCPTPDCQYIYRVGQPDTSVQCRLCLVHICTHCHVEHHEGISCEDYKASHSETEIQRSFDKWRESHDVKGCPNCSAPIEKVAGCNHMMCAVCRTHMCWVCLSGFRTGDEVYAHMRSRHGGIGL